MWTCGSERPQVVSFLEARGREGLEPCWPQGRPEVKLRRARRRGAPRPGEVEVHMHSCMTPA